MKAQRRKGVRQEGKREASKKRLRVDIKIHQRGL